MRRHATKTVQRSDTSVTLNGLWALLRFSLWWNSRRTGSKEWLEMYSRDTMNGSGVYRHHHYCILLWLWHMHILTLSPTLTLAVLLSPPHWRRVLSCSDPVQRAGLAGGGAGGKEGPHPWKLCGDAVAPDGNIYGQVVTSTRSDLQRCMCLNSDFTALFIQIPEFSQASDNVVLLVDCFFFWLVGLCDACAGVFELTLVESPPEFQRRSYKMGLHLKYSAVHKDAVASQQPGSFVSSTREWAWVC